MVSAQKQPAGAADETGAISQTPSRHSKRVAVACDYCRKKRVRLQHEYLYPETLVTTTIAEVHC